MGFPRVICIDHVFIMYLVLVCGNFLSTAINADEIKVITETQSKTYADFLGDVSMNIQHSSDPDRLEIIEDVSDRIHELYLPMRQLLKGDRSDKFNSSHRESPSLKTNLGDYEHEESNYVLYSIFKTLQKTEQDSNITSTCINDTGRLITSLLGGESWALQFLDATGKPGPALTHFHLNFVGDYDQCRAAFAPVIAGEKKSGYRGNYCVVALGTPNPIVAIQLGACLPSTCSSTEISSLMRDLLEVVSPKLPVNTLHTECRTAPTKVTKATIFAILILVIVGSMMILGTGFDVMILIQKTSGNTTPLSEETRNEYERISYNEEDKVNPVNSEDTPLLPTVKHVTSLVGNPSSAAAKVLLAFSVYSNGKKMLNTSQPPGSLGSIHGIRFLSMSWVIMCHVYTFVISFTNNAMDFFPKMFHRWTFLPIANGFSSVDTFFALSGLLTSYLTVKEMMRRKTWKINWAMFYFHRFWRLTPPYMSALVIVLGLTQYMGQGPLWSNTQPGDKVSCEKNWWTNLLYINNLVNSKEMCFGHTWYLANDMQFFVLSPLMLIPFYFHKLAGLLSCFILLLIHWITTGVLSTVHDWPTTTASLKPVPGRAGTDVWFNHYYIVPWCRIGPFVVGVMAGYVLALTKGRQFRMPWWVVTPGWVISVASGLAVVYGLRGDIVGENTSSLGAAAFYNAVSRSVWGACVCWVIIACSAGYGGPVNCLLSWSPFVVLGRLTYMSYLIHLGIVAVYYENLGSLMSFSDTTIVIMYLGILLFVNMVSFVAVLALESPMLGLEKAFIRKERKD